MNRFAIIHHDIEITETFMVQHLRSVDMKTDLFDIREVMINDLASYPVIINRVYASVANRDYASLIKCQDLVESLEEQGKKCINGYRSTRADYDKYFAYQIFKEANIPTPETALLRNDTIENLESDVAQFIETLGLPVIIKRNSSGRAISLFKIDKVSEIEPSIKMIFQESSQYPGSWIIQHFIRSVQPYDCRVGIVNGAIAISNTRSLLKNAPSDEYAWIGSADMGSKKEIYTPNPKEANICLAAARVLKTDVNYFDVVFGADGPVIIENNATPQFFSNNVSKDITYQPFLDAFAEYLRRI